jgi:nucleoid DNA-binding protein
MAVKKKAAKKKAPAAKKKAAKITVPEKYSFVDEVYQGILEIAEVDRKGEVKIKKSELKGLLETAMEVGARAAVKGQRVKLPFIGTLTRKDVPARKAGKATNPFTGEPMVVKARPASMKPRWSFPKSMKDLFAEKKNW